MKMKKIAYWLIMAFCAFMVGTGIVNWTEWAYDNGSHAESWLIIVLGLGIAILTTSEYLKGKKSKKAKK